MFQRLETLDDAALHESTKKVAGKVTRNEAKLIARIALTDRRRSYRRRACTSTFEYCRKELNLSESDACKYIQLARLALRLPIVLEFLEAPGREGIHRSGMTVLAPHLDEHNACELLSLARGLTRRQIRSLVCAASPLPPPPPTPPAQISYDREPANNHAEQHTLELTPDRALRDKLDQLTERLRGRIPSTDPTSVVAWAVQAAIDTIDREWAEGAGASADSSPRRVSGIDNTSPSSSARPARSSAGHSSENARSGRNPEAPSIPRRMLGAAIGALRARVARRSESESLGSELRPGTLRT
jgi:hypothetical protein